MEANVFTQAGQKSVIVPHTFGAGPLADWNWPNARFDCLLEIYQGCRGSYEAWQPAGQGEARPNAGERDRATSRRMRWPRATSTAMSRSAITAPRTTVGRASGPPTEDRAGLLDGMYASPHLRRQRRNHPEGDGRRPHGGRGVHRASWQGSADRGDPFRRPIELLRIDVVKDGKYVYTTRPTGRSATSAGATPTPSPVNRIIMSGCSRETPTIRKEIRRSPGDRRST